MFRTRYIAVALSVFALGAALGGRTVAQEPNPTTVGAGATQGQLITQGPSGISVYNVTPVERTLDVVNFFNRRGQTQIRFEGTNLLPQAGGDARINSAGGKTQISARFNGLTPANGFGEEFLTYVLWAISADGRPQNLGELNIDNRRRANLSVTTSFQSFGLIVTAEPYFAVSHPSDVVVLQNVFTGRTRGELQEANIHYQLLPRGLYANTAGSRTVLRPITGRDQTPLALYQARNARRIALSVGADRYAPDVMREVEHDLKDAEDMNAARRRDINMVISSARQATQRAEDARIISLRTQAANRQQQQLAAKQEAQQQAQQAQVAAAQAQAQADMEAARRARAQAAAAQAQAQAAAAQQQAEEAERQKVELRERLRQQLNAILQTTETSRGLEVNLSDVLFDTGRWTLRHDAQLGLARIATVIKLNPSLHIQVEGYTDSVGSPASNQTLSENRAMAVRDFLVQNGVPNDNITARGFGATNFVADNATADGRARNRRVDLIVSGDAIGVPTTNPGNTPATGAASQ
jgi:outer membrane protein OmpA-like peptidoglycan-associated protein